MDSAPENPKATAEEKLYYEVEKLKLEGKALKRPYAGQPATWVTLGGFLISVVLNLSQCSKTKNEAEMAEIRLARTQLAQEKGKKVNDSIALATTSLNVKMKNSKYQLDNIQRRIDGATNDLNKVLLVLNSKNSSPKSGQILADVKSTLNQINKLNNNAASDFRNPVSEATLTKDLLTAKNKEQAGFQALVDGNFTGAAGAFQDAENAYNGYHWAYELARLLRDQNRNGLKTESDKKALLLTIVSKYSRGAPQDLIDKLKQLAS
jgi:hypothetical protein